MTNPVPITRSTPPRAGAVGPTIIATARCVISGAGFLPDHDVTIRVAYNAEDVSDYLTYTTDADGHLYAELHASPATGALHITATDHRTDPHGACGLLWSNTLTVQPPKGLAGIDEPTTPSKPARIRACRRGGPAAGVSGF